MGCVVLERESPLAKRESRLLVVGRQVGWGRLVGEGMRDPEGLLSLEPVEGPMIVGKEEK